MITFSRDKLRWFNNKTISGEQLFFAAFALSLIASFVFNTTFMDYLNVNYVNLVNYLAFALLIVKIYIFDNFKWYEYIGITVILGLAFLSWRRTQLSNVMIIFSFIFAARGISFNKIVRQYFNINLMLMLLTMLYSLAGIIKSLAFFRGTTFRYSLGTDYPTDFSAHIFYLCLAYCYLNYKKMGWLQWLGILVIDYLTYLVTDTRVDALLMILMVLVMLSISRKLNTKLKKFIASSYWYLSIVLPYSYVLITYYFTFSNPVMVKLDQALSGRLALGKEGFDKYGITLLGKRVIERGWGGSDGLHMMKNNPGKYFFIDSSFVRLLVINGLILGIIALLILVGISLRETVKHEYLLPAILFLVVSSSLIDQHMLEITYNPFMLALLSCVPQTISGGLKNGKVKENNDW